MLKKNRATILLALTLLISPFLLTSPATAGNKRRPTVVNRRVINRRVVAPTVVNRRVINRRVVAPTVVNRRVINSRVVAPTVVNRRVINSTVVTPTVVNRRVIRLSNGDVRLPHGEVVSSRRLVRLRTQGYWQLPNGDYLLPSQELVPARSIVRLQNGYVRFPNGVVVLI